MTRQEYLKVVPRRNIIPDFEKEAKKYYNTNKAVLLCFMTDPYNELEKELRLTRNVLKIALKNKIPVKILTKSMNVLDDIDIIKKFEKHIYVGFTLTFAKVSDSKKKWEPEASLPEERIETLKILKKNNVHTWASFEPVIDIEQSLEMIEKSIPYVNHYKIGKLNNYMGLDKNIDWNDFLADVLVILRGKKPIYIKHDLRVAANKIPLYGNEILADEFEPEEFN